MIVKTPGSQMGSPEAAEGGGEARGGGRGESGERSGVQAGSTLELTVPKARSRSREGATLDEAPKTLIDDTHSKNGAHLSAASAKCRVLELVLHYPRTSRTCAARRRCWVSGTPQCRTPRCHKQK